MLADDAIVAALAGVQLIGVHGPWSRVISYQQLLGPPPEMSGPAQPLWGGAAKIAGARFTPEGGFDSIYLANDPITAFIEVSALVLLPGGPVPVRSVPWVVVSVEGMVSRVLDLSYAKTLAALSTNEQEMTGTWATAPVPPTQMLGRYAYESGRIAGIRYASAKHPGGINVVVFPDRLALVPTDYLEVYDPNGNLAQRLGS